MAVQAGQEATSIHQAHPHSSNIHFSRAEGIIITSLAIATIVLLGATLSAHYGLFAVNSTAMLGLFSGTAAAGLLTIGSIAANCLNQPRKQIERTDELKAVEPAVEEEEDVVEANVVDKVVPTDLPHSPIIYIGNGTRLEEINDDNDVINLGQHYNPKLAQHLAFAFVQNGGSPIYYQDANFEFRMVVKRDNKIYDLYVARNESEVPEGKVALYFSSEEMQETAQKGESRNLGIQQDKVLDFIKNLDQENSSCFNPDPDLGETLEEDLSLSQQLNQVGQNLAEIQTSLETEQELFQEDKSSLEQVRTLLYQMGSQLQSLKKGQEDLRNLVNQATQPTPPDSPPSTHS